MTRTLQLTTIVIVKKVLIVESLKPLIEQEKNILSNRGLEILTAASGEEALAVHKNEQVDLIVARLDMPGMAGDSLCSLVRQDETLKKFRSSSFAIIRSVTSRDVRSAARTPISHGPLTPEGSWRRLVSSSKSRKGPG